MRRLWLFALIGAVSLPLSYANQSPGPALASRITHATSAKKKCHYVLKKVRAKKKRVKVCTLATPTPIPEPTATSTPTPLFANPWADAQNETDTKLEVVVMNVEGQPKPPSLAHIQDLYMKTDPTTGADSIEAYEKSYGKDLTVKFAEYTMPASVAPANLCSLNMIQAENKLVYTKDPAIINYNHVVFVNPPVTSCSYGGNTYYENTDSTEYSVINGGGANDGTVGNSRTEVSLHEHELNHQFGAIHIFTKDAMDPAKLNAPNVQIYDYGSVMGVGSGGKDVINQLIEGSLTQANVSDAVTSEDVKLLNRDTNTTGIHAVRIGRNVGDGINPGNKSAIYLEYRAQTGEDKNQTPQVDILIWNEDVTSHGGSPAYHVESLPLDGSKTWTDSGPDGTGVTISLVASSASTERVTTHIQFPNS
jgi:hypothetical protein